MNIVQIAPPFFSIPPAAYGGIERVVYDLTEALVAAGHQVTLCAPGDSRTSAKLIPTTQRGIGLDLTEAQKVRRVAETSQHAYTEALALGADLIHDHTDYRPQTGYPLPIVRTIHGPAVEPMVRRYIEMSRDGDSLIAISERQRELFEEAAAHLSDKAVSVNFAGIVHNPTHVSDAPFYPREVKEDYVAFLGRCHWEKDPAAAIRIAMAAGVRLKMALRVTGDERPYFEACVAPLLRSAGSLVEFVGEIGGPEKDDLIGRAAAVVFPSPWEEPFGLVLVEAAARGTPVVAYARGAAPELVVDRVTGVLCDDEQAMAEALPRAMELDPGACRSHAETHFARPVIAQRTIGIYESVLARARRHHPEIVIGAASDGIGGLKTLIPKHAPGVLKGAAASAHQAVDYPIQGSNAASSPSAVNAHDV